VLWLFGVLAVELALLPVLAASGAYWGCALLAPLLGASAYKLTIVMHECSHRTLFRRRRLNRFVGLACGAVLVSDFDDYARTHATHHRHCGTTEDGEESDYRDLADASPTRLLLHLLKPLSGLTYLQMLGSRLRDLSRRRGVAGVPAAPGHGRVLKAASAGRPTGPLPSWRPGPVRIPSSRPSFRCRR
jgi:fatty acid desaturase